MNDKIKLEAEIDLSVEPNQIRVKSIKDDPWNDLGYWLEVTGFMAYQAMKYREWDEERIEEYAKEYIVKCLKDYKIKR